MENPGNRVALGWQNPLPHPSLKTNPILRPQWHGLSREEQAKYYEKARAERQRHMQMYPHWNARDNYRFGLKKKKRKREKGDDPGECASWAEPDSRPLSLSCLSVARARQAGAGKVLRPGAPRAPDPHAPLPRLDRQGQLRQAQEEGQEEGARRPRRCRRWRRTPGGRQGRRRRRSERWR